MKKRRVFPRIETEKKIIKGDCRNCEHASPVENHMVDCPYFAPAKVAVGIHICNYYKLK